MDSAKLASGDNTRKSVLSENKDRNDNVTENLSKSNEEGDNAMLTEISAQMVDDNEIKLKERISQCRDIIESLKQELNEEKAKLEKETKWFEPSDSDNSCNMTADKPVVEEFVLHDSNLYDSSIDCKLNCDESLIEYEKQLQKYQNTLNLAQMEKKNAIRKHMMAKAYKLKLLEVENQCNIELLRVKQSLQCLEPLQMIANKWKSGDTDDSNYDFNNFELMPRYPELGTFSGGDYLNKGEAEIEDRNTDYVALMDVIKD